MSYWHIVDALLVISFFRERRNLLLDVKSDKATTKAVVNSILMIALNVFFISYLIHNIWPDVAGLVHTAALCHG